jgi:hypothetical protein
MELCTLTGRSARQAAATLLKLAKSSHDSALAARLIQRAADLKEQAGELPAGPDAIPESPPEAPTRN